MKLKAIISIFIVLALVFGCVPIGTMAQGETTYYVSISGSDSNDGLSQEAPLKTISAVNKLNLSAGTRVLFKRGDIWRGETLNAKSNVYYGAYGEGEKPAFYGSHENYARSEYWALSDTPNVYKSTFTLNDDIGAIVFDNDSWVGERYDYAPKDLYKNGMFLVRDENENDAIEENYIYLFNNNGNPGDVYNQMEFIQQTSLIAGANDITIEDICLKYGNYGYKFHGTQKNVTLRRLDISFIGGKFINEESRGGNAIEFYGSSQNILVEDCYITQVYDTAFTCQSGDIEKSYFKNITLKNCDISYCHWTTEFWYRPYSKYVNATIEDVNITGNRFSYAGYGFGTDYRWTDNDTSKATFMNSLVFTNYDKVDIEISNNVFDSTKHYFFYSEFGEFTPTFNGNTYILTEDSMPGKVNGTLDTTKGDAVTTMAFEPNATIKYADKITNNSLQTAYNMFGNGDFEDDFADENGAINNWYCDSAVDFTTTDKIYGARALSLNGNSVIGNYETYSATPYILGFWYKGSAEVAVKECDGNILTSVNISANDWDYYYIYFTTPEKCKEIYIILSGNSLYDRMVLSPYPANQILKYQNGIAVLDDRFYIEGENVEFTVLPEKGYELDGQPVIACSDGSLIPSVHSKDTNKVSFTAPNGSVKLTSYFRLSGYERGENLIVDSGFDLIENSPWGIYWKSSLSTVPYDYGFEINKSGDKCMQIDANAGGIYQLFSVEKGKTYELSFLWAPCASGGTTTSMRVTVGDNYGEFNDSYNVIYNKVITSQAKRYQRFYDVFTATETKTVCLRLERARYAYNTVYVDDVSICKITEVDESKSYAVTVDESITNGSLILSTSEAKAGQIVEIEPKPDDSYALKNGSLTVLSENGTVELLPLDGTDKYYFVMPETAVTVYAEFEYKNAVSTGTVNILKDSGCDMGIGGNWLQKWGSANAVAQSDFTSDKVGDKCINIPWNQGGFYQAVEVIEGKNYELSFLWAPMAYGGTQAKMNIAIGDDYGDNIVNCDMMLYKTISSYNYRYERYTTSFTATKTGTVYVRFDRHDCNAFSIYVDDITLTTDYTVSLVNDRMFTTDDFIFGIDNDMTPKQVIDSFTYDNCEFCFDGEGDIKTGDTFTLYASGTAVLTRTAAIEGDCNSDGAVNIIDLVALKKYCVGMREFTDAEIYATRINGSGKADSTSLSALRRILMN